MVEVLTLLCIVAIVLAAALAIMIVRLKKELRLMAQFLEDRNADSNTRVTLSLKSKEIMRLAQAINDELDTSQIQNIEAQRIQLELQENLEYLSHDIRTPLTGAQGYAQLLEEEEDPLNRQLYLESIRRRLVDLRNLLDQLYVFTQVKRVDFSLEVEEVDASAMLSDVLVTHYPQFAERQLEPTISFEDESCLVRADEDALRRVFQNLVANALRYAKGQFVVCQSGSTFSFSNDIENPDSLNVDRLFERFYQGEESRTSQGSGLGLAIVEQLASKMGAQIATEIDGDILTITLIMQEG